MSLALVVAVAENGVIGRDNRLPWHISEDLRYFKQVTLGKSVLMGRKTFESIGRPLPGRRNIVLSRDSAWRADGVTAVTSVNQALALDPAADLMVIGGASLFADALARADLFYLTEIHRAYDGDILFPTWSRADWIELSRRQVDGDPPISFIQMQRRIL